MALQLLLPDFYNLLILLLLINNLCVDISSTFMASLNTSENKFILDLLRSLGCGAREGSVYLDLLKSGPSSIQDISKRLGENRITIHSATSQLLNRGLAFETKKNKRRRIVAEEPDSLFSILEKKERELEDSKGKLGYAVGILRRTYKVDQNRPTVRFYENVEGFKKMLEMTLSAKGEFLSIIDIERFADYLTPEYLESYFTRRAEKGIESRLIFPVHSNEFALQVAKNQSKYRISVRILNTTYDWCSGFISWNNCISMKSFSSGQVTCTILENDDISSFYRSVVFESLWNTAKVIKN